MEEDYSERIYRLFLKLELSRLNQHLPKLRKSLEELLAERTPSVPARDGTPIVMLRSELEKVASIIPRERWRDLKLPIVVMRVLDVGAGTYIVLGGAAEKSLVCKLLELKEPSEGGLFIYKAHLRKLIEEIGSLISIGFGASIEEVEGELRGL